MAVEEAMREVDRGFRLEDQLTLTKMRRSSWVGLLERRGKLRLSDHTSTIGVVVTPSLWHAIEELVDAVKILVEQADRAEIERLYLARVGHERKPAEQASRELLALLQADAEGPGE